MKSLFKKIYDLIPFKKQLLVIIRQFYVPPHKIYQHLSFKGMFKVKCAGCEFKIMHYGYELENEIFWKGIEGGWESECTTWWIKLCSGAKVIFDIGANTGLYSLIAKTVNQNAEVFAFEPIPKVFEKLKKNVSYNKYDIYCNECAVSDYDGIATIQLPDVEMLYSVTINQPVTSSPELYKAHKVKACRLSTFIEENKIQKIDLIKIDVETHEGEVLSGMGHYLSLFKPAILIEILNSEVAEKVEKVTGNLGYCFYHIQPGGNLEKVQHLKGHTKYYNYLLLFENQKD